MAGCVLDARERLVDRQHVSDMLCAINTEAVVSDAASESRIDVSEAADSRFRGSGGVLERCEALVRFECLREVPSALRSNVIVVETAREGTDQPSAGADSSRRASGGVLEGREGLVLFETLGKVLGSLCIESISLETAIESRMVASGGADSREGSNWQRT